MSELDKRHPLRRRYYRRVRNALVLAIGAHVGFFLVAPPYRPRPPVMTADPIHLLPAGVALQTAASVPAPNPEAPRVERAPSPAVRAAVEPEIRSEQWIEPEPEPAGDAGENVRAPGAGERNAPPVYYDYDVAPRAVRTVEPEYPESARNAGLEGTVVINLNLDERGRILRAWVASASAPEILVAAALDAVYQFEFSPGSSRGVAVRSTVAIPIRFTLKRTT